MDIIPVLDIIDGRVVRARGGERATYAPIKTPLARTSDPVDVAEGYLKVYPFTRFYVADLDGIEGRGRSDHVIAQLAGAFPHVELWVDNGLCEAEECRHWSERNRARLVLGSESQEGSALRQQAGSILSLDFRDDAFLGPPRLLQDSSFWPEDVIVMTLGRVGRDAGPDFIRVASIKSRAPHSNVFAAGGVRNVADLIELRRAGAAGVLAASALHDGRIGAQEIAAAQARETCINRL